MHDVKTYGLKLSDIRPCDGCGGPIVPAFIILEARQAVFNRNNVNSVLGTNMILGGRGASLGIAEAMAAGADKAIEVMDEPGAVTRMFICMNCSAGDICLALISERAREAEFRKTRKGDGQGDSAQRSSGSDQREGTEGG